MTDATKDHELLHALKVLVEMIDLYCPSLANSGGVANARALCSGIQREEPEDRIVRIAATDMLRYLDRTDATYRSAVENCGIDGHVNLIELARVALQARPPVPADMIPFLDNAKNEPPAPGDEIEEDK